MWTTAPPPLPNLDFKASAGDSLLAPAPKPILQTDMFTERIMADKLGDLKAEYLCAHSGEKRRLPDEIKVAKSELRHALGDATALNGTITIMPERLSHNADRRALDAPMFALLGLTSVSGMRCMKAAYDAVARRQVAEGRGS